MDPSLWSALIASLASLFGVAVGGGVTYLTNRQTLDRADARARVGAQLARLDDIHKSLLELEECHKAISGQLLLSFGASLPFDQEKLVPNPIANTRFLVAAFLPEGRRHLDEMDASFKELGVLITPALVGDASSAERKELNAEIFRIGIPFEKAMNALRECLYAATRKVHFG